MEAFEFFSKIFILLILKNHTFMLTITQNMEELIQWQTYFRAGTIGSNLFWYFKNI